MTTVTYIQVIKWPGALVYEFSDGQVDRRFVPLGVLNNVQETISLDKGQWSLMCIDLRAVLTFVAINQNRWINLLLPNPALYALCSIRSFATVSHFRLPTMIRKRLCILSDGTWVDFETETPTNIARLSKLISSSGLDDIPQIIFYDPGLGTSASPVDRLTAGAFGKGIDRNIIEPYIFLALNYLPGDDICMFGYSRGAYTVRSLAGLMNHSGLVRKDDVQYAEEAYEIYRLKKGKDSREAVAFRELHGPSPPIQLLCCFDTVGSLGIPAGLPGPLSLLSTATFFEFHDTNLSVHVENAIHAASTDEDSIIFRLTPMVANSNVGASQVTERFLPGFHSSVGGGSTEEEPLSINALRFVITEIANRRIPLKFENTDDIMSVDSLNPPGTPSGLLTTETLGKFVNATLHRTISSVAQLDKSVIRLYIAFQGYRPKALEHLEEDILRAAKRKGVDLWS